MATTSELAQRIDDRLQSARKDVLDLPMHDSDWPSRPMHQRMSLFYEWEYTLDSIAWLYQQYQDGNMSGAQAERFRELVDALRDNVPILERLDWPVPLVTVEGMA